MAAYADERPVRPVTAWGSPKIAPPRAAGRFWLQCKLMDRWAEMVSLLDEHDALVRDCVTGRITFGEFEHRYDAFYVRCALDGHESAPYELEILHSLESRISLHREVWEQVITKVTSDELVSYPGARDKGFISPVEATSRLSELLSGRS